jgi:phage baseplate assembly protein W
MDAGRLFGRGIAFPPRVGADGRIAWSQGEDNIRESMYVILMTEATERLRLPEFGGSLRRFLFEPNTVAIRQSIKDRILRSLARWESRITVESVSVEPDPAGPEFAVATIKYKLIATQVSQQLSVTVSLAAS